MNTFIVMGRLSEEDDVVRAVTANNNAEAGTKFESWVRTMEDEHDASRDFYIESNTTFYDLIEQSGVLVSNDEYAAGKECPNIFIVLGRLCDNEDYLKAVLALSHEEATAKFEAWVRQEDGDDDIETEFYIEHCTTYEKLLEVSLSDGLLSDAGEMLEENNTLSFTVLNQVRDLVRDGMWVMYTQIVELKSQSSVSVTFKVSGQLNWGGQQHDFCEDANYFDYCLQIESTSIDISEALKNELAKWLSKCIKVSDDTCTNEDDKGFTGQIKLSYEIPNDDVVGDTVSHKLTSILG